MKLYPIVEGHGEVEAVPILLRRLLAEAGCHRLEIGRPLRRKRSQLQHQSGIHEAIHLARLQPQCCAVVVLFDSDDDCPAELAERVRNWARQVAPDLPCEVVVAHREYETWFLAALESLRGKHGIAGDAVAPTAPEARRDAKSALEAFMPADRAYSETGDQPGMTALFSLQLAHQRNRSFRKMVKVVGELLGRLHLPRAPWPPPEWMSP